MIIVGVLFLPVVLPARDAAVEYLSGYSGHGAFVQLVPVLYACAVVAMALIVVWWGVKSPERADY